MRCSLPFAHRAYLCGLGVADATVVRCFHGPIIEEVIFRGAAFSVIYMTACSSRVLAHCRIGLSIVGSSLLFVLCHGRASGVPWMVIFLMGNAYALLRWRSNSAATSAVMHATYNCAIAIAMIHAAGV